MIHKIRESVRRQSPLIHCITNPISIQQCANAVLAVGARPIMAEHPKEVREITETADALLLNLGNITDVRMEAMLISAETAKSAGIPVILDAVGIACSSLRRTFAGKLTDLAMPTVIKGNYSEIKALDQQSYRSSGVDADSSLDREGLSSTTIRLARRYHTVILASGKEDIITDGRRLVYIKNGVRQLSAVTGTGCMLGALCAAYLSVQPDWNAAAAACAVLGICGQLAETQKGNGSFLVNLFDALSTVEDREIEALLDMEEIVLENI